MNRKISIHVMQETLKQIFTFHWNPNKDLIAVAVTVLLVMGGISIATNINGQQDRGGIPYFIVYAVITAALCGVALPLYWTVFIRHRSLESLGMTRKWLRRSHFIQLIFVILQFAGIMGKVQFPPLAQLLPLIGLAMFIGFFETVFWRGWVQTRLEAAFGILPSVVLSAALYALHYLAYGASLVDLLSLFLAGLLYSIVFRLTSNVLIIWPVFLPMRILISLINDGRTISMPAVLGLFGVWLLMLGLVRVAGQYHQTHTQLPITILPVGSE
ncbi:CPBP family intramembrane glutamic endopeptidase [Ornatilinea apprima]|nr:CPBP family intramembrane glutamic endopeptidase [Ornatilinea apprima]